MSLYVDGFTFPIREAQLEDYRPIAEQVAHIWKEYGALEYFECTADEMHLKGTRTFSDAIQLQEGEIVIFGWVMFPSKEVRNTAHRRVAEDPRIPDLMKALSKPPNMIFDAKQMLFGGFRPLIQMADISKGGKAKDSL